MCISENEDFAVGDERIGGVETEVPEIANLGVLKEDVVLRDGTGGEDGMAGEDGMNDEDGMADGNGIIGEIHLKNVKDMLPPGMIITTRKLLELSGGRISGIALELKNILGQSDRPRNHKGSLVSVRSINLRVVRNHICALAAK